MNEIDREPAICLSLDRFMVNSNIIRKTVDVNGLVHCTNGPAVEYADGSYVWYKHDKVHREGGPASYTAETDTFRWYQNNKRHREDGPAVMYYYHRKGPIMFFIEGYRCSTFLSWLVEVEKRHGGEFAMKMKLKWSNYRVT